MKILDYFEEIILFVSFVVITAITFINILSRNFMQLSLSFTEEVTINLLVLLTFVGTSLGVRRFAHLGFTLLYDKGSRTLKRVVVIVSSVASSLLFLILLYFGVDMVMFQMQIGQTTPALNLPQWIWSLALPIGAFLCLIRTVQALFIELKILGDKGQHSKDEKLVELKGEEVL